MMLVPSLFRFEVPNRVCCRWCRNFKSSALARRRPSHRPAGRAYGGGPAPHQCPELAATLPAGNRSCPEPIEAALVWKQAALDRLPSRTYLIERNCCARQRGCHEAPAHRARPIHYRFRPAVRTRLMFERVSPPKQDLVVRCTMKKDRPDPRADPLCSAYSARRKRSRSDRRPAGRLPGGDTIAGSHSLIVALRIVSTSAARAAQQPSAHDGGSCFRQG